MSENVFDRFAELLESPGPVNWKLAREVAESIAGSRDTFDPGLVDEYRQLTRAAQLHIEQASGLAAAVDIDQVEPVDRVTWANKNLESFRYLVDPLADKMADAPSAGPLDALLQPLGPAILGLQMGSMVGFLSHRVLGQFDVGLPAVGHPGIYFVVPNVEAFAQDHQIDPPQARLWVALHEVTHQAEFGLPWVTDHFLGLIDDYIGKLEFDPSSIVGRLESVEDPEEFQELFQQPGGLAGLLTGPEQQQSLTRIQAFMSVLEGYGDYLMDRAAPDLIPDAPRLREAIDRRRAEPSQGEQLLQQLLGLELKRQQYRLGAEFCREVERRWGADALANLWGGPEGLPTLEELEDPVGWAARVLL